MSKIDLENKWHFHNEELDINISYRTLNDEYPISLFDSRILCVHCFKTKLYLYQLFGDDIFRSLSDWKRTKVYYF